MEIKVFPHAESVAAAGADFIAAAAADAANRCGRFVFAISGGHTPWLMLRELVSRPIPWAALQLLQVDERVAPENDPDRNMTHIAEALLAPGVVAAGQVHAMPVGAGDLESAAARYAGVLHSLAGSPPVIDLVHLGLGPDGHTASLVPGDATLGVTDRDVAVTGVYQGRRRMTLTYRALNSARRILWIVTGEEKRDPLRRLYQGDTSIPAGRVRRDQALILADEASWGTA